MKTEHFAVGLLIFWVLSGCQAGIDNPIEDEVSLNTSSHLCGNGILEEGEECDDGDAASCDGCSTTCEVETFGPVCGNGTVEPAVCVDTADSGCCTDGESCDDGNTVSGDGCSATCQIETPSCVKTWSRPVCGNGIVEACNCPSSHSSLPALVPCQYPPEQCDDGNTTSGDGCSRICQSETSSPVCGNGIVEKGEVCDPPGPLNSIGDTCLSDCRGIAVHAPL